MPTFSKNLQIAEFHLKLNLLIFYIKDINQKIINLLNEKMDIYVVFIFCNVKIMERDPYLGVYMPLLMIVYEWVYLHHHPSCSTV